MADAKIAPLEAVDEAEGVYQNYFAFESTENFMLPDGVSFIECSAMNEGKRREYLNRTSKPLTVDREGKSTLQMRAGDDRKHLLEASIVGWNLHDESGPVRFDDKNLRRFLSATNPKLIDDLVKFIQDINPWLMSDVTVEDIDDQIRELEELRAKKVREEEGNDD